MYKSKILKKLMMLILLAVPTLFFLESCQTAVSQPEKKIELALPQPPALRPVTFERRDCGLSLSAGNYRNLENNIIEYRRYISELEAQLSFYKEEF